MSMKPKTAKKPAEIIRKEFLRGNATDENTMKNSLIFFGSLLIVFFMSFVVSATTSGNDIIRLIVSIAIIALTMVVFFNKGSVHGAEAVARGEILWQKQEKGQTFSESERRLLAEHKHPDDNRRRASFVDAGLSPAGRCFRTAGQLYPVRRHEPGRYPADHRAAYRDAVHQPGRNVRPLRGLPDRETQSADPPAAGMRLRDGIPDGTERTRKGAYGDLRKRPKEETQGEKGTQDTGRDRGEAEGTGEAELICGS